MSNFPTTGSYNSNHLEMVGTDQLTVPLCCVAIHLNYIHMHAASTHPVLVEIYSWGTAGQCAPNTGGQYSAHWSK